MIPLKILSVMVLLASNFDDLGIGFPLVLQILCPTVIDVVLFGDLVQLIDTGIAMLQSFLVFGAWPHVLIPGPVKFDARLGPPFLKVEATCMFFVCQGLVGSSHNLALKIDFWSSHLFLISRDAIFLTSWPKTSELAACFYILFSDHIMNKFWIIFFIDNITATII